MNWVRENKFLTGFIVVVVLGAGALGYLLYSAYGTYSDVTDQYNTVAGQLHQLQSRVPYPDQPNLKKYKAEREQLREATHNLATTLSGMVLPVKEITPSAFQDQLRDTINTLTTKAGKMGVQLPKEFAYDFTNYQTQPPPAAAAGPLARQLEALDIVMNILLDDHIDSLTSLTRTKLTQEGGVVRQERGGGRFGNRSGGPGGGGNGERSERGDLVEKVSFDIQFTAGQPAFQKVLDDIAASGKQFFITRTLVVSNSDPKPVAKAAETPAAAGAAAAAAASQPATTGTDASVSYLKFLVGTEKLNVAMRIDMVTFHPPPAPSTH
jgi:hypothetical protein